MNTTTENASWEAVSTSARFGAEYTDQERASLAERYGATLFPMREHEVVKGAVMAISNRDVIINVGFKADGLVPLNEFRDMPGLKSGDEVEVYVEERENAKGQLVLSRKKAKLVRGWERIQAAAQGGDAMPGIVKRKIRGGLIVDIYGIETFLPGSQIDVKPVHDFDAYVGKSIDVAVLKINRASDNVVVSHKVLIEQSLESQKSVIISQLKKGQILEGIIKNMTKFGVFIDLGGIDGLLHITDISWGRIGHPEEVLSLGQKVKVVVIDFDEVRKRISLGMKQLESHPWEALPVDVQTGSRVKGTIVNIADYGAFLELMPGVEGLIHISEMSWSQYPRNIRDLVSIGDQVEAVVLTIDREDRRMSLGIRQLTSDPWDSADLLGKYAVGTRHQGIVRNMTHFGVFVELEEGIEGLLHVSDLSWTRKVNHPSETVKTGETVETVVLEIDPGNKRLALGRKQLEDSPWDVHAEEFQVGSVHQGTIVKKMDKGVLVTLPHDMEGFVPKRHLSKKGLPEVSVGETLELRVIEFSQAHGKMVLSHTAVSQEDQQPADASSQDYDQHRHAAPPGKTIQKSTLGDLEVLSGLKEKMREETEDSR